MSADAPRLETARLVLRHWSEADVAAYRRIVADPDVMRYMGSGLRWAAKRSAAGLLNRLSDVEARRTIQRLDEHWRRHGFGEWAVEERARGELIGQIGLNHHPDWTADPAQVEIGWLLARHTWGRGYAIEGARAALEYAFDALGMERLVSIAHVANGRSEDVMRRLGLTWQGRTRWKRSEVVWYGIDREDWERGRERACAMTS